VLRRRQFRTGKKRGDDVGPTKRGKGTKFLVVVDGQGVPVACTVGSASPSETKMIEPTLDQLQRQLGCKPKMLVMDKAYDSEKFRDRLAARGIDPVVPYRKRAVSRRYDDPVKMTAYRRRWLVERTFAWMTGLRRVLVRHERLSYVYRAFIHLACVLITLRQF
jgi:transposase